MRSLFIRSKPTGDSARGRTKILQKAEEKFCKRRNKNSARGQKKILQEAEEKGKCGSRCLCCWCTSKKIHSTRREKAFYKSLARTKQEKSWESWEKSWDLQIKKSVLLRSPTLDCWLDLDLKVRNWTWDCFSFSWLFHLFSIKVWLTILKDWLKVWLTLLKDWFSALKLEQCVPRLSSLGFSVLLKVAQYYLIFSNIFKYFPIF